MNRAGLEKAAVLLLSLGEDTAAEVLRFLSPYEVGELGRAMREVGAQPRERVEAVMDEYAAQASRQTGIGTDADQFLDAALTRALGEERARPLLSRIAGAGDSIRQLALREPAEIAGLLRDEHPQLIAAVLAQLDRAHAAATLEWLPEAQREDVVRRLAGWQGTPVEALREMEDWLARQLQETAQTEPGAGLAADLLTRVSPAAREEIESGLAQHSPHLLEQLKAQQLELDDLPRLADDSRTRFFKAVPAHTLLLALKGADPDMVEALLGRMPTTAACRLKDDLESLGAARVADIESAQAEAIRLLRNMARQGQLTLEEGDARS
jgi:flagellar motor switch protein FliG